MIELLTSKHLIHFKKLYSVLLNSVPPILIFSGFLPLGGHYQVTNFNFQRAISRELLKIIPLIFFIFQKSLGVLLPIGSMIRLGQVKKTMGGTLLGKFLREGHYYVGGHYSAARSILCQDFKFIEMTPTFKILHVTQHALKLKYSMFINL